MRRQKLQKVEGIPDTLEIHDPDGWTIELSKGSTAIVLTERAPTRSDADQFLVRLEDSVAEIGPPLNLLKNADVIADPEETIDENHIVGIEADDVAPIRVLLDADVTSAVVSSSFQITFVLTARANKSWDGDLDEWAHLIDGVIVLRDGGIHYVCTLDWAADNRAELLSALGRN